MKQPSHESTYPPAISTLADRKHVMDSSDPGALESVATRTNTTWSSDHHLKAAGVSALITVEKIIVWTVSVLLAAFFLIVGGAKLANPSGITGGFSRWPNPTLLYLLVRAVEISVAVMLLIPRCASLGAVGLAAMMAGIVGKHLTHNESSEAIVPSVLLALLGIIAYARKPGQM